MPSSIHQYLSACHARQLKSSDLSTCLCLKIVTRLSRQPYIQSNQPHAAGRLSPFPFPSARESLSYTRHSSHPALAVARPHAHHVGNPEATLTTVRCCALPSQGEHGQPPTAPSRRCESWVVVAARVGRPHKRTQHSTAQHSAAQ